MKAAQFSRFGGPEVLELADVPRPAAGPGQVLVRVGATGINFAETSMRQNKFFVTPVLPAILGSEVAGTVESLGAGVTGVSVGARVAVPLFASGTRSGGYAEYVAANADLVFSLPDGLSFESAAAVMIQGFTAFHLTKQVPPDGKNVLINAAGGGVGSMLVQFAKKAGAKSVIAAASTAEKLDLAASLGADVGVDYSRSGWIDRVRAATGGRGPDVIYEASGYEIAKASLEVLAPLGRIAIYGSNNIKEFQFGVPELKNLIANNQSLTGFASGAFHAPEALRSDLAMLFGAVMRGELKVTIGGRYSLDRAADAHRALEGRKTIGKVVLIP